ncbi:uncharacterized protein [Elaeis guineensis]
MAVNYEAQQEMNKVLPFEPINQAMPGLPLHLPRQMEHVKIPNSPQTGFRHPQMSTVPMEFFNRSNLHPETRVSCAGNVFIKINNQIGTPSVPKDQEMVMSTLEEEDQFMRGQQSKKQNEAIYVDNGLAENNVESEPSPEGGDDI